MSYHVWRVVVIIITRMSLKQGNTAIKTDTSSEKADNLKVANLFTFSGFSNLCVL